MKINFLIKSETVNIDNYTIKDIPGSSGRLDVISRCILSALIDNDKFEESIQIFIFFNDYGTFIFNTEVLSYSEFPKNELLLSDYIVKLIKKKNDKNELNNNPLKLVDVKNLSMIDYLKDLKENKKSIFVLKEDGDEFINILNKEALIDEIYFIIGNQSEDFINSKEFMKLNIKGISVGTKSYLASSVIRLIKFNLKNLLN
ncbi:MAG: hypothetical protein KGD57_07085 [Candidatus Lokiarchaeota archaeon]|nr:hypothetical protein [Candidatus Lokiarchaeota archaeon]